MTLEEMNADLGRRFVAWPEVGDYSTAATGEPYVEVVCGGQKGEGESMPVLATSESVAIRMLHDAIIQYAASKERGGVLLCRSFLYWRVKPDIDSYDFRPLSDDEFKELGPRKLWAGYARLLISDKPRNRPQRLAPVPEVA